MAPKIGTNATTLRQWQSMGELMQVDGIGKQYAELLVRCGVDSVETLRKSNPESLLAKINKVEGSREVRIQGSSISLDRVKSWISAAGDLQLVTA